MSFFDDLLDSFAGQGSTRSSGFGSSEVSDSDVPSGSGGINRERYTYGELRRQPIIPELMRGITNAGVRRLAQEANDRCRRTPFVMRRIDGEYCFKGLHVGPIIALPSAADYRRHFGTGTITAAMIRDYNYALIRSAIARECGITDREAALAIGNQLDCAPHEDISGTMFLVPNWAHKWFRHDGYVSRLLATLNN
jgi:hypothetical protein